jgi:hypothetical protein
MHQKFLLSFSRSKSRRIDFGRNLNCMMQIVNVDTRLSRFKMF